VPETATAAPASAEHLALFSTEAFHALNLRPGQSLRRIDHEADGRLVGSLVGVVEGDRFHSGHSAPFGGPDFVRDAETAANVTAALTEAVARLDADGVRTIRVTARPAHYSGSETAVQFALLNLGFAVAGCELSFHIDLSPFAGPADYVAALRSPARRALRHAMDEPFALEPADDDHGWERGYRLLAANRAAKGRTLALSLDYVLTARDAFPGRVRMFTLAHDGASCAAALVYRVAPRRELVVYWGDAGHELPRSPMNALAHLLVTEVMAEGALVLDLGPSSVAGVPDQGLIQFKRSVLARESLRLDLVRTR
jgi:hypothetical protein